MKNKSVKNKKKNRKLEIKKQKESSIWRNKEVNWINLD